MLRLRVIVVADQLPWKIATQVAVVASLPTLETVS